jgi:hypothetical protein
MYLYVLLSCTSRGLLPIPCGSLLRTASKHRSQREERLCCHHVYVWVYLWMCIWMCIWMDGWMDGYTSTHGCHEGSCSGFLPVTPDTVRYVQNRSTLLHEAPHASGLGGGAQRTAEAMIGNVNVLFTLAPGQDHPAHPARGWKRGGRRGREKPWYLSDYSVRSTS